MVQTTLQISRNLQFQISIQMRLEAFPEANSNFRRTGTRTKYSSRRHTRADSPTLIQEVHLLPRITLHSNRILDFRMSTEHQLVRFTEANSKFRRTVTPTEFSSRAELPPLTWDLRPLHRRTQDNSLVSIISTLHRPLLGGSSNFRTVAHRECRCLRHSRTDLPIQVQEVK